MSCHILCPECRELIGDIYPVYERIKNVLFDNAIKKSDTSIDKVDIKPEILPDVNEIFEFLDIKNNCCRAHIMGTTNFSA